MTFLTLKNTHIPAKPTRMSKILLLNHKRVKCGTWQFFNRLSNLALQSTKIEYAYREVDSKEEYFQILDEVKPTHVIYNYHWDRMQFFIEPYVYNNPSIKHYFIWHDGSMVEHYDMYLFFGVVPPEGNAISKKVLLPRPLFDYKGEYPVNKFPTIGSFGFGFWQKQFPEIVKMVNKEFSKAVINIHTTYPYFGEVDGAKGDLERDIYLCRKYNTNPNIELNITTDFWDNDTLVTWLAGNDLNVFNYSLFSSPGISAATDYALSVKRPIAITNHDFFRHIVKNEILIEKNSLKTIMEKGVEPLQEFYDRWKPQNFIDQLDGLFI